MQLDIEEAEGAEKEAVAVTTRAQEDVDRAKRTTASGANATPPTRRASRASTPGRNGLRMAPSFMPV